MNEKKQKSNSDESFLENYSPFVNEEDDDRYYNIKTLRILKKLVEPLNRSSNIKDTSVIDEREIQDYSRTDGAYDNELEIELINAIDTVQNIIYETNDENEITSKINGEGSVERIPKKLDKDAKPRELPTPFPTVPLLVLTDDITFGREKEVKNSREKIKQTLAIDAQHYEQGLDLIPKKYRISYAEFIILQFFGNISFATRGQINRYLEARHKFFDKNLEFHTRTYKHLADQDLIAQTEKNVVFTRGKLKNSFLRPFYLTNKGKNVLARFDWETAEECKSGEPNEKMLGKLEHELLVTEIYVNCFEENKFVFFLLSEEQMRSRRAKDLIYKNTQGNNLVKGIGGSLGDFKISYFDAEKKTHETFDGEVAVKYRYRQIKNKPWEVNWYCYDLREAEKIYGVTGKMPKIIGGGLLDEVKRKEIITGKTRKVSKKDNELLQNWIEVTGGITNLTAKHLLGKSLRRLRTKLANIPETTKIYTNIKPGRKMGRGLLLIVADKYADNLKAQREILTLNLLCEFLVKHNYTIKIVDKKLSVKDENGNDYELLIDANPNVFLVSSVPVSKYVKEKITQNIKEGKITIVGLLENINTFLYHKFGDKVIIADIGDKEFIETRINEKGEMYYLPQQKRNK